MGSSGFSSADKQNQQAAAFLPEIQIAFPAMELFNPSLHVPPVPPAPFSQLPLFYAARAQNGVTLIPREEDCIALWDRYAMLDNIRLHCRKVADLAQAIAFAAVEKGFKVSPEAALAAGLLHDLGKTYTIKHGGNHAQLGAAWVMRETRNGPIAQAVIHHYWWPFVCDVTVDRFFLCFAVLYADKRVRHDEYVSLDERFNDLFERYGINDYAKSRVTASHIQGQHIEAALSKRLGVNLNEYTAYSGRLVK